MYRVLLFGTSKFAIPSFNSLLKNSEFEINGLITQPDKPVGRKKIITPPETKLWAEKNNIPVIQPLSLKTTQTFNLIKKISPDLILVIAYGKLIPNEIIKIPRFGTLNVHPSKLPLYRGPSPIQYAILNGEKETAVSIMLIDEEMDHGPILKQELYKLNNTETLEELSDCLAELTARILPETLHSYLKNEIKPVTQDHSAASFTKLIETQDGELNFNKSAQKVEQRVRALQNEPGTYFLNKNKRVKVRGVHIIDETGNAGIFFEYNKKLAVYCATNAVVFDEIQQEGKQWIKSELFLQNGGKKFFNI